MKAIGKLIEDIQDAPDGPRVAAFFDFDGTLIAGYSAFPFIREQLRTGRLTSSEFVEVLVAMTHFGRGKTDFADLIETSAALMEGESEKDYIEFGESVFRKFVARMVYPESRALVDAHLAKGHTVALVSSATAYQVTAAAQDLGIEHVMCSHLEVKRGKFTGKIVEPLCWGEGKVTAAKKLAKEHKISLKRSFFYSDGHEDLPLLETVGHPRVLNARARLRAVAKENGWPCEKWTSRGRPRATDFMRSLAATYSLVPSFAAAIPVWALTGSKREAINYSTSLFADTAGALIGLNINVTGEHHLWEQRPAVFVFNHQSKTDVVIMSKLIRKDIAGVGKQEIRRIPVIGQILELGGVVMIDRKNASSAIEAMAPLVAVMRDEGKSVCMAPEGTRTISPKLAPFKKGAFHLAIQAGVPMVPVVIQNAMDIAPKGNFVFRPGSVDVEVLPPIDTSQWTAETINEHVAEVRALFLEKLGQVDEANGRVTKRKSKPRSKAKSKAKSTSRKPKAVAKRKTKASPKTKPKAAARKRGA